MRQGRRTEASLRSRTLCAPAPEAVEKQLGFARKAFEVRRLLTAGRVNDITLSLTPRSPVAQLAERLAVNQDVRGSSHAEPVLHNSRRSYSGGTCSLPSPT